MSHRDHTPKPRRTGIVIIITAVVMFAGVVSFVAVVPAQSTIESTFDQDADGRMVQGEYRTSVDTEGLANVVMLGTSSADGVTQIDTCLVIIDQPGRYELTEDLNSNDEVCIDIRSSDVILDGNGHTIDGVDTPGSIGIYGNGTDSVLSNVTVRDVTVTDWGDGVSYTFVNDGHIANVVASGNEINGIDLVASDENTLTNNTASNNGYDGISIRDSHEIVTGFETSDRNIIVNNTIRHNGRDGIDLHRSVENTLTGNIIANNSHGLHLSGGASQNVIYNNLLNNSENVVFSRHHTPQVNYIGTNSWNVSKQPGPNIVGGPFLGGNYYAHLDGTGYSQTCTDANGDGFCDQPYDLATNADKLPLTKSSSDQPDDGGNGKDAPAEDEDNGDDAPPDEDVTPSDEDDAPPEGDDTPPDDEEGDSPPGEDKEPCEEEQKQESCEE